MTAYKCDILIIGAGIIGLTTAHHLIKGRSNLKVIVIDKETQIAAHGSGRNSGVLHSGIYYANSSLKARFCRDGNHRMREFARAHGLAVNECGKLVVATTRDELTGLHEIARRAAQNECKFEMLSAEQAERIEPNVRTVESALFAPETASVDPRAVCNALVEELRTLGVELLLGTAYLRGTEGFVETSHGTIACDMMINAAGLYADRIAHDFSLGKDFTLLPFKGLYLKYTKNRTDLKTHIYPVPDLRFPFLGVHFTKTVDGIIKIGPTAIPAFWRENYSGLAGFKFNEFAEVISQQSRLFAGNNFHFRDLAFEEVRKYRKSYLIALAQRMVKHIDPAGFTEFTAPGIRAQLLNKRTRELVQDFVIERTPKSVHILNAVSPGFTCSFPFADYVIEKFL